MPPTRNTLRALATTLAATLLLASAISTATARNLSVNNQNIRAVWRSLEFISGELVTVRCRVTLEGRLHSRTIVKSRGTLIGGITRIDFDEANCTNGSFTPLRQISHLTYEGFTGTLPEIRTAILLLSRISFRLTVPGLCTSDYGNETDNLSLNVSISSRELSTITLISGRNRLTRTSGSFFCPGTAVLGGTSDPITLLGTTTRIRITLI